MHWDAASTAVLRENQQGEHAPAAEQIMCVGKPCMHV